MKSSGCCGETLKGSLDHGTLVGWWARSDVRQWPFRDAASLVSTFPNALFHELAFHRISQTRARISYVGHVRPRTPDAFAQAVPSQHVSWIHQSKLGYCRQDIGRGAYVFNLVKSLWAKVNQSPVQKHMRADPRRDAHYK